MLDRSDRRTITTLDDREAASRDPEPERRGPPQRRSVSIIMPVHNRASLTRQCLDTLLAMPYERAAVDIIVVDDASSDTTSSLLDSYGERIRAIRHTTNRGFAVSCNDGAAAASGAYLLFLNNDTVPRPGWLDALVRYAERHPEAAVVGSKLLFPDETIQHAGVVICQDGNPRHIYAGFPADHPAVNKSRRFQIVTGACMLVRRAAFEQAGGFDTIFVNGHEDVDLCLRLGELGHEIHYCHESVLVHLESVSRGHLTKQARENGRRYVERWHPRVRPDDLHYYVEDGLLGVRYPPVYPLNFTISPTLGNMDREQRDRSADHLLFARSRQVLDLLKDNITLNVRVREAEFQARRLEQISPGPTSSLSAPVRPVSIIVQGPSDDEDLRATLESVTVNTDLERHHLLVLEEASGDRRLRACVASFRATIVSTDPGVGVTRSVNRVIRQRAGDVVLLDAGTVVTPGWLEKLHEAANARPNIASVTPLANRSALGSIPRVGNDNDLPAGFTLESFARFIEKISLRTYPELPTASRPCIYITHDALRAVGSFDELRFRDGFGAENDWGMRALKQGYLHLLDDATYVHVRRGSSSPGMLEGEAGTDTGTGTDMDAAHMRILNRLHPEYLPLLREFRAKNPLQALHTYVDAGIQVILDQDNPTKHRVPADMASPGAIGPAGARTDAARGNHAIGEPRRKDEKDA